MRIPLVAGNWKMNGLFADGTRLAGDIENFYTTKKPATEVLLCPPATLLAALIAECGALTFGGQDCHAAERGAYTGCISAQMLKDLGAAYVILGHSERREQFKESSAQVAEKVRAAHGADLKTIICLGETLEEREAGQTLTVIEAQVAQSCPETATGDNTVIAYEPVWAIGTGLTASTEQISEVHTHIRHLFKGDQDQVRILYGGSVKPDNAAEIFSLEDVDGALVGGASLEAESFCAIIAAADQIVQKAA